MILKIQHYLMVASVKFVDWLTTFYVVFYTSLNIGEGNPLQSGFFINKTASIISFITFTLTILVVLCLIDSIASENYPKENAEKIMKIVFIIVIFVAILPIALNLIRFNGVLLDGF